MGIRTVMVTGDDSLTSRAPGSGVPQRDGPAQPDLASAHDLLRRNLLLYGLGGRWQRSQALFTGTIEAVPQGPGKLKFPSLTVP